MATDVNMVMEIGRLTRDIEIKYLPSGTAVGNISIAVNRSIKRNDEWTDEVSYFDVVLFGKTAETLKPYLNKGKQICVEGHLKQDRWEKDGQKFSRISIIADNVQLLGGKSDSGLSTGTPAAPADNSYQDNSGDFPEDILF